MRFVHVYTYMYIIVYIYICVCVGPHDMFDLTGAFSVPCSIQKKVPDIANLSQRHLPAYPILSMPQASIAQLEKVQEEVIDDLFLVSPFGWYLNQEVGPTLVEGQQLYSGDQQHCDRLAADG